MNRLPVVVVAILITSSIILIGGLFWEVFYELLDFRLYQVAFYGGFTIVFIGIITGLVIKRQIIGNLAIVASSIAFLFLLSFSVTNIRNIYDLYRLQAIVTEACKINGKVEMQNILSRAHLDEGFVFDYVCSDTEGQTVVMSGYVFGLNYWRYSHLQGKFVISE